MFCIHCGKEIPDNAAFCSYCGKPLQSLSEKEETNPISSDILIDSPKIDSLENHEDPGIKEKVVSEPIDGHSNSPKETAKKEKSKFLKRMLLGALLIVVIGSVLNVVKPWVPNPFKVKETGTYQLEPSDTIRLESIKTDISFINVSAEPNYDNMTAEINFFIAIDIPEPKKFQPYLTWLNAFEVNGNAAEFEIGTNVVGMFMPLGTGKTIQAHRLIYRVMYTAQPTEKAFNVICNINENLMLEFTYNYSFWELDNVNKSDAIAYQQGLLDGHEIKAVNTKELADEYIEGNIYCISGTATHFGKEIFSERHYVVLDTGNEWAAAYGYFDADNWEDVITNYKEGDEILFFGEYDSLFLGSHSFASCYIYSPAGKTFWIHDDGSYEILSGKAKPETEGMTTQNQDVPIVSSPSNETISYDWIYREWTVPHMATQKLEMYEVKGGLELYVLDTFSLDMGLASEPEFLLEGMNVYYDKTLNDGSLVFVGNNCELLYDGSQITLTVDGVSTNYINL